MYGSHLLQNIQVFQLGIYEGILTGLLSFWLRARAYHVIQKQQYIPPMIPFSIAVTSHFGTMAHLCFRTSIDEHNDTFEDRLAYADGYHV